MSVFVFSTSLPPLLGSVFDILVFHKIKWINAFEDSHLAFVLCFLLFKPTAKIVLAVLTATTKLKNSWNDKLLSPSEISHSLHPERFSFLVCTNHLPYLLAKERRGEWKKKCHGAHCLGSLYGLSVAGWL